MIETIIIILAILVVINLFWTWCAWSNSRNVNIEGFEVNPEALSNLASILNTGNLKVTNLEVTSNLKATNADIAQNLTAKTGKITGAVTTGSLTTGPVKSTTANFTSVTTQNLTSAKSKTGPTTADSVTVSKSISTPNVTVSGVAITRDGRGFIRIPSPVEINNAISRPNQVKPGIIVPNIISTTAPSADERTVINNAIGSLKSAYYVPGGSWIMGVGRKWDGRGGNYGSQTWYAKKFATPHNLNYNNKYHAYYAGNGWRGGWTK